MLANKTLFSQKILYWNRVLLGGCSTIVMSGSFLVIIFGVGLLFLYGAYIMRLVWSVFGMIIYPILISKYSEPPFWWDHEHF